MCRRHHHVARLGVLSSAAAASAPTGSCQTTAVSLHWYRRSAEDALKASSSSFPRVLVHCMSFTFDATLLEVAKAHLRDAFLLAQPALTRAVKLIFERKFGSEEWLSHFKPYLGRSMREFAVDDGRAFDMYASLLQRFTRWARRALVAVFHYAAHHV